MRLDRLLAERKKDHFYIMHLSYDGEDKEPLWNYAKENNVIGLDYPSEVNDDWNHVSESVKERVPRIWVKQFEMFCNQMREGDIVIILEGWHSILGIAEVEDRKYRYEQGLSENGVFFDHIRRVKWIKKHDYGKHPKLPRPVRGFRNTLYRVERNTGRWSILSNTDV